MWAISDGSNYIGVNSENVPTRVGNKSRALFFEEYSKAENYIKNIKATLRKFRWEVVEFKTGQPPTPPTPTFQETDLENDDFNISEFFCTAITTISQLRDYAKNMEQAEKEYNLKIQDVRHYKRDSRTKLNAIQLQRLEQYEIKLERERWECKSNGIIAKMFIEDFSRLEDRQWIKEIKAVKESEYKPKVLSYEVLDEIVGKVSKSEREVS